MKKITLAIIGIVFIALSCNTEMDYSPREINFDRDVCHVCRMGLTDQRYNGQAINQYGEVHWYDDIGCLIEEMDGAEWKEWKGDKVQIWFGDAHTGEWIDAQKAWYEYGNHTPMGYGYGALKEKSSDSLYDFNTVAKRIRNGQSMREAFVKEKKMSMHGSGNEMKCGEGKCAEGKCGKN